MMIDKQKLLDILTSEIESSTGCTDPGSVCLAVAVAAHTLGRRPEKIDVLVSPNIYKNGVSVGIPGTNRIGLELAAALGALLDEPERGLAILADVTGEIVQQAAAIVSDGRVHVAYGQTRSAVCAGHRLRRRRGGAGGDPGGLLLRDGDPAKRSACDAGGGADPWNGGLSVGGIQRTGAVRDHPLHGAGKLPVFVGGCPAESGGGQKRSGGSRSCRWAGC